MNYIYRMTHIDNIPHILRHGITHRDSVNADPSYIPIGDTSIIDKRMKLIRETVAGEKISLGDFIPFYFFAACLCSIISSMATRSTRLMPIT